MSRSAIYPGSFDPITYGHIDLIKRASHAFDEIIVAVAEKTNKNTLFSTKERLEMVKEVAGNIPNVRIESFSGLVIDYARKKNIRVLIRGLRMISDFEYELQMALTNRRLDDTIETVFLMPSEGFSFLSSKLIKEVASLDADISSFVPDSIADKLRKKLGIKK
ncbi:MAG TPA: pantetheine-phosphate adenylyltransferase [Candidatus Omnitrophota bacterium]|nr:pantetheine-phosphate adenylyltransferase [Candidatus Omnitrophota bacterium]